MEWNVYKEVTKATGIVEQASYKTIELGGNWQIGEYAFSREHTADALLKPTACYENVDLLLTDLPFFQVGDPNPDPNFFSHI